MRPGRNVALAAHRWVLARRWVRVAQADPQEEIPISDEATQTDPGEDAAKAPVTFGGLTPAEASRRRWEKERERLAQGGDSARRVKRGKRTPLDALRDLLEGDPERYANGVAAMMEKGDPRALGMLERLFAGEAETTTASTVEEIEAMDTPQLKAFIAQLEGQERLVTS